MVLGCFKHITFIVPFISFISSTSFDQALDPQRLGTPDSPPITSACLLLWKKF